MDWAGFSTISPSESQSKFRLRRMREPATDESMIAAVALALTKEEVLPRIEENSCGIPSETLVVTQ